LHHSIASLNRSAIQAEFDELFKLNDHLAFGILFPLVGAGCIHQVELLLRRNSVQCCEKLDKDGRNALHEAASRNAVEVAEALHRASKDKINFLNLKVTNSTNPIFQLICNPRP
jgi:ankyrin repeat protein